MGVGPGLVFTMVRAHIADGLGISLVIYQILEYYLYFKVKIISSSSGKGSLQLHIVVVYSPLYQLSFYLKVGSWASLAQGVLLGLRGPSWAQRQTLFRP